MGMNDVGMNDVGSNDVGSNDVGNNSGGAGGARGSYTIDCSECVGAETEACDDCIVRFIVGRTPCTPVPVDEDELRALRVLADAGIVGEVRHLRAVS